MVKNYFLVALRNFLRNKTFSMINVAGLSIGISAALVIFLIASYEFGYDQFGKQDDRIYRVVLDVSFSGTPGSSAAVPAPLGDAILHEMTGIEKTVPVFMPPADGTAKVAIASGDNGKPITYKKQKDIVFTNQQYFGLLSYHWIAGSAKTSLQDPFSVVLTEDRARQYFPNTPVSEIIGKQITYNDDIKTTVSGIVISPGRQTSFTAEDFISLPTIAKTSLHEQFMMNTWNDWMSNSQLFIELSPGSTVERTELQLKALLKKYNKEVNNGSGNTMTLHLQPLTDLHFNSNYQGMGQRIAHKPTLYGMLAIAAFLLLLGCFNFINLTTANASQRAKEIGVRKTMGSSKKQLIFQFLTETFLLTIIATAIAIALTPALLNLFNNYIPDELQLDLIRQPHMILFLLLLIITISFFSGLYPALVLSAYKPAQVLKTQAFVSSGQTRNAWIRKSLSLSQFTIAQFFIIVTFMVSKQIHYTLNKDLGFRKDAIVNFEIPFDTIPGHGKQLLREIKEIPGVEMAGTGFLTPASAYSSLTHIEFRDDKKNLAANVHIRWGDPAYLKIYQIKLLSGRNVEPSDSIKEFLINQTLSKTLGFRDPIDAVGRQIDYNGKKMPIVGVMQDFHEQSLHSLIGPVIFAGNNGPMFHIRLKPNNANGTAWQEAIKKMQGAYKQIYPENDFSYTFFDESIAGFYKSEQDISHLLKWATALAILISCLGLSGMAIYTTNIRTKEIGIRKVLGASVIQIVSILTKEFVQLVVMAFIISSPVAWWIMHSWLDNFVYRTTMNWWVFLISGFCMLFVALSILSFRTIKTAMANPVKSLRTE